MNKPTSKLILARNTVQFAVEWSTAVVISSIIVNALAPKTPVQKAQIQIASFALGGMVAKSAGKYAVDTFDDIVVAIEEGKAQADNL